MPYTQFVEVGRIAVICLGELVDKLAVIVDIVDDNRVVVDVIGSDAPRQTIAIKRFKLTDFVVKITRGADVKAVQTAVQADSIVQKFQETKWGQRIARKHACANLNDFARFKREKLIAKREELVQQQLAKH